MTPRIGGQIIGGHHKETHQDGGADEIDLEGLENKAKVIWKDASEQALSLANQTSSITWTDLDLTAYTSANAKIAILRIRLAVDSWSSGEISLTVRKNGTTPTATEKIYAAHTVNLGRREAITLVGVDADEVIEYYLIVDNGQTDALIDVVGYIE